ncbi:MAG: TolC family protein [Bacteroidales bacterium]|nr:TolC family protein [Bacteroidales bacterium]
MNTMIIKRIMILCMVLIPFQGVVSQQEERLVLTLDDAQEYALSHNKTLQGARLDVRAAEMAKWDVLANGLPRVDGSGSLNDNLKLMTNLLPAEIFGGEPGTYIPVQFGTKYNTSYGIQATQLIFSAPYFVGLRMASLTEKMSNQALEKSELDIRESVISTYYLILVSEESLLQVEKNIDNLRDILKSTEAMYSVGMAEATDVDQIKSNITMIENSRRSVERNIEFSYNLLLPDGTGD